MIAAVAIMFVIINVVALICTTTKKKTPPGPWGLPLLGNLLQFDGSEPLAYLRRLSHRYGGLTYLRLGSTPTLVVSTAKLAKQVLKTHDQYLCTRPPVHGQQKLSYEGADVAFSPYNSHWKEMRRLCMHHLLSPTQVLSFRPVREDQVGVMMKKIGGCSEYVNMSELAMSLATNIICGVAFGTTFDEHDYERKRLDRLVLEAQALMVSFYFTDHFPLLAWVDRLSGLSGRLDKNFRELDAFYQNLIHDHQIKMINSGKEDEEDIIDLMLKLKQQSPESITCEHIKGLLMDLFVAGTDTVAAGIVWTMTALMQRPDVMRKMQAHVREAVDVSEEGMMIKEEELGKFPYLKAVVMEALRLYPPAPLLYRSTSHDDKAQIVVDGYEIEKGSTFIINAWAIARDPENWEDAEEFVPERFMKTTRMEVEMNMNMNMLPFGGGRRRCPGMGMGMVSVHLALANLLYSYDWALPPSAPIIDTQALPGLTMHKKNPLLLVPTRYHRRISLSSSY